MNRLLDIQGKLQETTAAISRTERSLVQFPDRPSLLASLSSFEKRYAALEKDFLAIAHEQELDICSYKIETDFDRPVLLGVASVLADFQRLFTSVYDALTRGPKQTSKAGVEIIEATSFGVAYMFPGSIGMMLTIRNDRLLAVSSNLDDAMHKTLELIQANNQAKVQALTDALGVPTVRLAHRWASENIKAGFGADIAWRRNEIVKDALRIQPQEIERLASTIKATIAKEDVTVVGQLLYVDTEQKTFRMRVIETLNADMKDETISGTYDTAITSTHPAQLPKIYRATLNVRQRAVVDDGQEEITYLLLRLDPADLGTVLIYPPVS
jgi:hypothetical protein